jgi:hypothetical protein
VEEEIKGQSNSGFFYLVKRWPGGVKFLYIVYGEYKIYYLQTNWPNR